jgi:O-antigen/teichoic acid export membrane protein
MSGPVRRRNPLPEGAIAVGAGLAVTATASYAFLIITARVIGPVEFGAFSILWSLVFLIGGCLVPFEQDVSRRLVARRVNGVGGRPVVVRAVLIGVALVSMGALVVLAASPWLIDRLFNGEPLLVVGLILGMLGYLAANLTEGTLSGNGRFARYGTFLGGETLIRVAMLLVCLAIGVRTAGPIGLALGGAPLVMAVAVLWRQGDLVPPGPPVAWRDLIGSLSSLLTAALLSFAIINGPPVLLQLIAGPDQSAEVGVFTAALIVARVPLLLWQAIQAALLPGLAKLASQDGIPELRRGVTRLTAVVFVLVVVGTVVSFAIGPQVIELLFGSAYPIDHRTVGLLALASGGFVLATALALAIVALGGTREVPIGWATGFVVMVVVVSLGGDALLRVELAFVAATWSATVVMALLLRRRLRLGATISVDDAVVAMNDLTFEA